MNSVSSQHTRGEGDIQNGGEGDPSLPLPPNAEQLDSNPHTKQLWESPEVHLKNVSNSVEQNTLDNYTKREGRTT